jgi:cell division protein FtsI/penicillin-binding protein 2
MSTNEETASGSKCNLSPEVSNEQLYPISGKKLKFPDSRFSAKAYEIIRPRWLVTCWAISLKQTPIFLKSNRDTNRRLYCKTGIEEMYEPFLKGEKGYSIYCAMYITA